MCEQTTTLKKKKKKKEGGVSAIWPTVLVSTLRWSLWKFGSFEYEMADKEKQNCWLVQLYWDANV